MIHLYFGNYHLPYAGTLLLQSMVNFNISVIYFQVITTPQIGFVPEVMASAPPPYSEYGPPPQVTDII